MAFRSPLTNVITAAVTKAARALRRDFNEVEKLQVSRKGPADFVSHADRKMEKILLEELKAARPDYGFLMEETGEIAGSGDRRFVIDPIDGTTNFLHSIPHFAMSIAVEQRAPGTDDWSKPGEIVAGVVYNPLTDELFWAEKGQGAYLNDQRLRVSARDKMNTAVFATGIPFMGRGGHEEFLSDAREVMAVSAGIRRFGAASLDLAYVAAGRFDGYWEDGLQPWDLAAGILIVREAGGYVTDITGKSDILETGSVIAANDRLHAPLERAIKRSRRALRP